MVHAEVAGADDWGVGATTGLVNSLEAGGSPAAQDSIAASASTTAMSDVIELQYECRESIQSAPLAWLYIRFTPQLGVES